MPMGSTVWPSTSRSMRGSTKKLLAELQTSPVLTPLGGQALRDVVEHQGLPGVMVQGAGRAGRRIIDPHRQGLLDGRTGGNRATCQWGIKPGRGVVRPAAAAGPEGWRR